MRHVQRVGTTSAMPWRMEDVGLARIGLERLRGHEPLLMLVCAASFIESGSDTYAGNLATRFADDPEVCVWLRDHWEPEELQHGRALKAYVQRAWPDFDWERAYAGFFAEYSQLCRLEKYESSPALEMAGRCIVEMGTTTFYEALSGVAPEPVLRDLTWRIRADEVQHYKHFYAYFVRYRGRERPGRLRVLAALARRMLDVRRNDAGIALRHVTALRGHRGVEAESVGRLTQQIYRLMRPGYPVELAVRMALKPLQLPRTLQRGV